jgi:hypothetical protein
LGSHQRPRRENSSDLHRRLRDEPARGGTASAPALFMGSDPAANCTRCQGFPAMPPLTGCIRSSAGSRPILVRHASRSIRIDPRPLSCKSDMPLISRRSLFLLRARGQPSSYTSACLHALPSPFSRAETPISVAWAAGHARPGAPARSSYAAGRVRSRSAGATRRRQRLRMQRSRRWQLTIRLLIRQSSRCTLLCPEMVFHPKKGS